MRRALPPPLPLARWIQLAVAPYVCLLGQSELSAGTDLSSLARPSEFHAPRGTDVAQTRRDKAAAKSVHARQGQSRRPRRKGGPGQTARHAGHDQPACASQAHGAGRSRPHAHAHAGS